MRGAQVEGVHGYAVQVVASKGPLGIDSRSTAAINVGLTKQARVSS